MGWGARRASGFARDAVLPAANAVSPLAGGPSPTRSQRFEYRHRADVVERGRRGNPHLVIAVSSGADQRLRREWVAELTERDAGLGASAGIRVLQRPNERCEHVRAGDAPENTDAPFWCCGATERSAYRLRRVFAEPGEEILGAAGYVVALVLESLDENAYHPAKGASARLT